MGFERIDRRAEYVAHFEDPIRIGSHEELPWSRRCFEERPGDRRSDERGSIDRRCERKSIQYADDHERLISDEDSDSGVRLGDSKPVGGYRSKDD